MKSIRCALFSLLRRDLSLSLAENSGVRINRRFKIVLSFILQNTVIHGNVTHGDEQMDRVTNEYTQKDHSLPRDENYSRDEDEIQISNFRFT